MTAEALTEAEREALADLIAEARDEYPRLADDMDSGELAERIADNWLPRILADRLAAVQPEIPLSISRQRDEWYERGHAAGLREGREQAETRDLDYDALTDRLAAVQAERAAAEQERDDWRWSAQGLAARAESAEAERDALRERVEALADEPEKNYPDDCGCNHGVGFQFHAYPCRFSYSIPRSALRAALDADPSTDPSAGSERA